MPNGEVINNQLEFKEHLKKMSTDEKIDFIAGEVYFHTIQFSRLPCKNNNCPENTSGLSHKKRAGVAGIIAVVVYALVELGLWLAGK